MKVIARRDYETQNEHSCLTTACNYGMGARGSRALATVCGSYFPLEFLILMLILENPHTTY